MTRNADLTASDEHTSMVSATILPIPSPAPLAGEVMRREDGVRSASVTTQAGKPKTVTRRLSAL